MSVRFMYEQIAVESSEKEGKCEMIEPIMEWSIQQTNRRTSDRPADKHFIDGIERSVSTTVSRASTKRVVHLHLGETLGTRRHRQLGPIYQGAQGKKLQ
jgi:hypothetical protein